LHPAAVEESLARNEEGIGALAHNGCKSRIDLADRCGFEHLDL
jgi:hypothetical protein